MPQAFYLWHSNTAVVVRLTLNNEWITWLVANEDLPNVFEIWLKASLLYLNMILCFLDQKSFESYWTTKWHSFFRSTALCVPKLPIINTYWKLQHLGLDECNINTLSFIRSIIKMLFLKWYFVTGRAAGGWWRMVQWLANVTTLCVLY